jgi:hypothetical protein
MSDQDDPITDLALVFHLAANYLHELSKRSDSLSLETQVQMGAWMCEYERIAEAIWGRGYPRTLAALKETLEKGSIKQ